MAIITDVLTQNFGREILRCEVGSSAYGTSVSGTDDFDMMGIVIPNKEHVLGLNQFEHKLYRTAAEREGRNDARSGPGDIDLTWYSLRKFVGLAKKGNPSILMVFFAPVIQIDEFGVMLRESSSLFVSKEAGKRFLGYMNAQRARLAGERGQKGINRPELVEKYGYDTKYAYHIIRLGLQGLEFLKHGKIQIPISPFIRDLLLAIRNGNYTKEMIIQWACELETDLLAAIDSSALPEQAPEGPIDRLLVDLHEIAWKS
jgi:predicted nucleotidyltransferase